MLSILQYCIQSFGSSSHGQSLSEVMAHFGSVLQTMLSLYMAVTGGNDWSLYYTMLEQMGSFYHILFIARLSRIHSRNMWASWVLRMGL